MTSQMRFLKLPAAVTAVAFVASMLPAVARAQAATAQAGRVAIDRERGQSVDDLVALALRQAPAGLAARARTEAAKGDLDQASRRPNPSLAFERRDQAGGMDSQTSVAVTWPLDLFRRSARMAVAQAGVASAGAEAAERDRQIANETRVGTIELVAALAVLAVRQETAASNRRTLDLIAARVEAGSAPAIDRDIAAIEANRSDVDVWKQRGQVDQLASRLRSVVGLRPEEPLLIRQGLEEIVEIVQLAGTPDQAAAGRPDVRAADAEIARAQARADSARREGRPEVSLVGSYMRMLSGFPQLGFGTGGGLEPIGATFHNVAVGAMVTLPLRNRNQGAIAAALAEAEAARHEREARHLDALNEIDGLRRREAAARQAVAVLSDGTRGLSAKALEVARESYQLGRATLIEVLTETRRRLDVDLAFVDALRELADARAALRAALGGGR